MTDLSGISAQNNANPFSIFPDHVLVVRANGVTYDPSYGSMSAFESAAIAGFAREMTVDEADKDLDLNGNGTKTDKNVRIFAFRKNEAGQDLL